MRPNRPTLAALAALNVAVLVIAGITVVVRQDDSPSDRPSREGAPPEAPAQPVDYVAATANLPSVSIFPDAAATAPSGQLANPTIEGFPLTFSVLESQGDRLLARLPERPNGATAWINAAEVRTTTVPNKIVVDVDAAELRVLRGDEVLMQEAVAVGKPATPTPLGTFFVDISLANPGSPYGAHILSVSGFSDVLLNFGGGRGQIAIHGWSDASAMGKPVSNGCVRMTNDVITRLAPLAPVGTPVEIVP